MGPAGSSGESLTAPVLNFLSRYLVRVVGCSPTSVDSMRGHNGSQVVSLHQQLVLVPAALLVDVNNGSGHLRDTLDHHLHSANVEDSQNKGLTHIAPFCKAELFNIVELINT